MKNENKWLLGSIALYAVGIGAIAGALTNYREILEKKRKEKPDASGRN